MGQPGIGGFVAELVQAVGHVLVMFVGVKTTMNFVLDPVTQQVEEMKAERKMIEAERAALNAKYLAYIYILRLSLIASLCVVCSLTVTLAAPSVLWAFGFRRFGITNGTMAAAARGFAQRHNVHPLTFVVDALENRGRRTVPLCHKIIINFLFSSLLFLLSYISGILHK